MPNVMPPELVALRFPTFLKLVLLTVGSVVKFRVRSLLAALMPEAESVRELPVSVAVLLWVTAPL